MQGSLPGVELHGQDYREIIQESILSHYPGAEIVDPWTLHPDSPSYGDEEGKACFLELAQEAGQVDCLIAYLPEASMGTAVEMWRAYEAGVPVLTISPLAENWVVRFLSARIFSDFNQFADFIAHGGLEELRGPLT